MLQLHQKIHTEISAATPGDNPEISAATPEDKTEISAATPEENAEVAAASPKDNAEIFAATPEENTGNFVFFPSIFLVLVNTIHSEALNLLKALISPLVRTNTLK